MQMKATLKDLLAPIEASVANKSGASPEILQRLRAMKQSLTDLGDQIDVRVDVPIKAGAGRQATSQKTTFFTTITGTATVISPANGTWSLIVNDLDAKKCVLNVSNAAAGGPVPFAYTTGFHTTLEFVAQWSVAQDTTLSLDIVASY
jgi:hypothetical protein